MSVKAGQNVSGFQTCIFSGTAGGYFGDIDAGRHIVCLLDLAAELKQAKKSGREQQKLAGKNIAVVGCGMIGGYLADMLGKKDVAEKYTQKAKEMAAEWVKMADDGDHYRLTFDKPGTWSQKYNLVWDKLLNLQIFPKNVAETEIAYYLSKQNKYGLPLDNRETYTKTDWIMWTATLANDKATFEKFIEPVYLFMNVTPNRVPMSDWVFTDEPNQRGFQARSVVGGYYIKMLEGKLIK